MASSFFALFDDIATLLDDVAAMTKVATKKTAGVLGDDLALNAQQVGGVAAERELPVVWAVAKGSLKNKAILVPAALAISALAPWAIQPLLMMGGAYLCYEGVEKLAHTFLHKGEVAHHHAELAHAVRDASLDMLTYEKEKIKGAVRTDFILSAEIIVIALGTIAHAELPQRIAVLTAIALVMTVGVYGLVAAIVKLDDLGLRLQQKPGTRAVGNGLIAFAPRLMKCLSIAGTAAMFLVGGGILVHGIAPLHHWVEHIKGPLSTLLNTGVNLVVGVVAGAIVLAVVEGIRRLRGRRAAAHKVPH